MLGPSARPQALALMPPAYTYKSGTGLPVEPVEAVGWDGDAIEAQAFGFLAVRSLRGLPLSLPSTTGVPVPTTGGQLHHAA